MDSCYRLRWPNASTNHMILSPSYPLASAGTMALSEEHSSHLHKHTHMLYVHARTHMHHLPHMASGPFQECQRWFHPLYRASFTNAE